MASTNEIEGAHEDLGVSCGEPAREYTRTGDSVAECNTADYPATGSGCDEKTNSLKVIIPERTFQSESSSDASISQRRSSFGEGDIIFEDEANHPTEALTPLTELSSEPCEDRASVASDGSGSSDATSSEPSAPRKSPTRPRLIMDCVIPPPFYIPKKLFRPMIEVHPEMVSNADDESIAEIPDPEPGPSRSGRGQKRKRNRSRSRSRSPLHVYSEEQALEMFGRNLTMYSVCGPPGGYLIGVGTLQCHPEDNGRASFNFDMDGGHVERLAEGTQRARDELLASNSVQHTRTPKPQAAKRKSARPKDGSMSRPNQVDNYQPTQASSCHLCSRKSNIPKMTCSGLSPNGTRCKARFCERCIQRKFPDVRFDAGDEDFTCPRCAGYCPCAACTRGREKGKVDGGLREPTDKDFARADSLMFRSKEVSRSPISPSDVVTKKGTMAVKRTVGSGSKGDASTRESLPEDDVASVVPDADTESLPICSTRPTKKKRGTRPSAKASRSCHQCRNRNNHAKMSCTNELENGKMCDTHYCHRCIASRYPDFAFTANGTFTCFRCKGTCNCDLCARSRGEEYIKKSRSKTGKLNGPQLNLPMAQSRSGRTIKPSEKARHLEDGGDGEDSCSRPRKKRRGTTPTSATDNASTASSRAKSKSAMTDPSAQIPLGSPLCE